MRHLAVLPFVLAGAFASPVLANPTPFDSSVDEFFSHERGFSDGFDDGTIGPQWLVIGTVSEANGVATFSNPGVPGFLAPFPLDSDTSGINGFDTPLDGFGTFTATSIWLPEVPDPGTSFSMALGSVDGFGDTHQIALSVTNTKPAVAAVLSTNPGLNVDLIVQVRDLSFLISSWQVTSQPFDASDVTSSIVLSLVFNDLFDTVQGVYSLDGGLTLRTFDPVAWNFPGGQYALVASATSAIPEPGSAALLGLGLAGWGASARRRRARRRSR